MGACSLEIILISFFSFFLFFPNMITSDDQETCYSSDYDQCSMYERLILPPFRLLKGRQPDRNPGFDLTCNRMNKTVLKLPFSGEFYVGYIYYYSTTEIGLNDPDNCLPKRILNLNLLGSPFEAFSYQNHTFLNCSVPSVFNLMKNISSLFLKPIDCLSSFTHKVLVTSNISTLSKIAMVNASCEIIATVPVPVPRGWSPVYGISRELEDNLILTWNNKQSNDGLGTAPPPPPQGEIYPMSGLHLKYIFLGIPTTACFIWCCCAMFRGCGPGNDDDDDHLIHIELSVSASLPPPAPSQPVNTLPGLDVSTIRSYPKMVFSKSEHLFKQNNTMCPICLSDYQPKDTLRSIPVCNHCFHATCIDGWLRVNATCPVCRKSLIDLQPHQPVLSVRNLPSTYSLRLMQRS